MAYVYFDSGYAPCGFLIVPKDGDPYADFQVAAIREIPKAMAIRPAIPNNRWL